MTEPARRPAESPLHAFFQLGGIVAVVIGILLNVVGLISLALGSANHPPKLLVLSLIGLPLIVVGIVMMTIGFTAAARRIRHLSGDKR